jgi:hypothetical protein
MPHQIGYVDNTGGVLAHYKMLETIKDFASLNGWSVLRYDTAPANRELILKGAGLSGTEEIFVGFRTYQDANADYYNLLAGVFTGYVAGNSFDTQPGARLSGVPAHNNRIDYWLTLNGQRIALAMKVGTPVYESAYVGKCLPYGRPSQYPYPVVCGGMLTGAAATRFSDTSHSMPYKGNRANMALRSNDGWLQPYAYPWQNSVLAGTTQLRDTGDVYHLLPDRHQPTVADGVADFVVIGDGLVDLPERLFVGPVGRGGHAQDAHGIVLAVPVQDAPIAGRRGMVPLVHYDDAEQTRVEPRHATSAVAAGGLRLDAGDDHARPAKHVAQVCAPVCHLDVYAPAGVAHKLRRRLVDQLVGTHFQRGRVTPAEPAIGLPAAHCLAHRAHFLHQRTHLQRQAVIIEERGRQPHEHPAGHPRQRHRHQRRGRAPLQLGHEPQRDECLVVVGAGPPLHRAGGPLDIAARRFQPVQRLHQVVRGDLQIAVALGQAHAARSCSGRGEISPALPADGGRAGAVSPAA